MTPLACPSCGAPLPFRTSFAVFAVCRSCGAAAVRRDRDVSSIGTVADLPDEVTPFQVGTDVEANGRRFTLAGRVRMAWADGFWNEWFMVASAGDAQGWLAEAQGTLAMSFPCPAAEAGGLSPAEPPGLGEVIQIRGEAFRVSDLKEARCIGSEGELPFAAPVGRAALYADMLSDSGGFAGAEYGPEGLRLFLGRYVAFNALRPRHLRPVEGWAAPIFA